MKKHLLNKKANTLLNILFIVPLCTYVITGFSLLLIYHGSRDTIELLKALSSLAVILALACIGFFVVCLANLKNKEVPLHKKLIVAGLNFGAFLFVAYTLGSHF